MTDRARAGFVVDGKCPSTCGTLPVYLVLLFFIMLTTFFNNAPATTVVLRCLPLEQR